MYSIFYKHLSGPLLEALGTCFKIYRIIFRIAQHMVYSGKYIILLRNTFYFIFVIKRNATHFHNFFYQNHLGKLIIESFLEN